MTSCDLVPTEFNIIIELDEDQEVTAGGIFLPVQKVERNRLEETEGTLIAASPLAFTYAADHEWAGEQPRLGSRVLFARYAGILTERGGRWFRVIKDKELAAVIVQDAPALAAAA